jgi:hypothetical protein
LVGEAVAVAAAVAVDVGGGVLVAGGVGGELVTSAVLKAASFQRRRPLPVGLPTLVQK